MADLTSLAERVWYADDALARSARGVLAPLAAAYGGVVRARGVLFDRGVLQAHRLALPALSVGNVTVGGTGKTPVASWLAARLRDGGARPAIVLRGYGGDEPLVHARLVPDVPVVVDADRVRGAETAARAGADVVVLDDAFQHRRARRDADIVLVSAEHATRDVRLLPAGPYREPLAALRRASLVVVTRKSADAGRGEAALRLVAAAAPDVPRASVALCLDRLHRWDSADSSHEPERVSLDVLRDADVVAVAAIGDPSAFFGQLRALGARVDGVAFPDHHAFGPSDVALLARRARDAEWVVCTLKDAVKLGPAWPRLAPPLWYVSQRVAQETGGDALNRVLARVLSARAPTSEHAGSGRSS